MTSRNIDIAATHGLPACPRCRGTGKITDQHRKLKLCPPCHGTGDQRMPRTSVEVMAQLNEQSYRRLGVAVLAQAVKDRPAMRVFALQRPRQSRWVTNEKGTRSLIAGIPSRLDQMKNWVGSEHRRVHTAAVIDRFLNDYTIWHAIAGIRGVVKPGVLARVGTPT